MAKVSKDPVAVGSKTMSQRDSYAKAMKSAYAATKVYGVPKKMSPEQIAKRKRSMISNAATKLMGGLYSK